MAVNRVSPKIGKVIDIPDVAPTIGTATAGDTSVSVAFTPASSVTGGPIFSYKAVSNPGSISGTGTSSPITVSGLTNGTAYTFTVAGTNATGDGPYSAASNSATPIAIGSYESIATVEVGAGGASYVEFTSIPNTYTHLQIRGIGRMTDNTVTGAGLIVEFNSDTTDANYKNHGIYGNGTSALAYDLGGEFGASLPIMSSTLANANVFGTTIFDILDYKNTNKYKTVRNLTGYDNNGSGTIRLTSGLWMSTSAITSIKLTPGAVTLTQYSHFALYGIKGAA